MARVGLPVHLDENTHAAEGSFVPETGVSDVPDIRCGERDLHRDRESSPGYPERNQDAVDPDRPDHPPRGVYRHAGDDTEIATRNRRWWRRRPIPRCRESQAETGECRGGAPQPHHGKSLNQPAPPYQRHHEFPLSLVMRTPDSVYPSDTESNAVLQAVITGPAVPA